MVEPEVEPEVVPEVEPLVEPLVEPAFSDAEQALNRTSDEHNTVPVSPESSFRFIGKGKVERIILWPLATSVIRELQAKFIRIFAQQIPNF